MNPNYTTLNKDIGLIQRTNNGWDIWFNKGDTVKAEDFHSLQVGIILACLTSWNYMNRYGNPTYEIFGNRAYELLKANKNSMVAYKIQQYFIECLKRMRRVYQIVTLEVSEIVEEPYTYFVEFEVISINNQLVSGSFTVNTDQTKSTSFIDYELYTPYASNKFPLQIDVYLKNEYGGGLADEILYMYVQEGDTEPKFEIVGKTDRTGYLRVNYTPEDENIENNIHFVFNGNTNYNPSSSEYKTFETEQIQYHINFLDEPIITTDTFVDLHIKLQKELKSGQLINMSYTQLTITGNDDSIYTGVTNDDGEATVRVKVKQNVTYTTFYDDATDTISVTKPKITPIIKLISSKDLDTNMEYSFGLFDVNENQLIDNLMDLMVMVNHLDGTETYFSSFEDGVSKVIIPKTDIEHNEPELIINVTPNDYYNTTSAIIDPRTTPRIQFTVYPHTNTQIKLQICLLDENGGRITTNLETATVKVWSSPYSYSTNSIVDGCIVKIFRPDQLSQIIVEFSGNKYYYPVTANYDGN